jgi:hypothetical protein
MNKLYVKYAQDKIGEILQNDLTLNRKQIEELLRISGELEILKDGLYP